MTQNLFKSRVHSSFVCTARMAAIAPDDAADRAEGTTRSLFVGMAGDF